MDHDRRPRIGWYAAIAAVAMLLALRFLGGPEDGEATAVALDGAAGPAARSGGARGGGVWVHVAGAVRRPGLYRVRPEARAGVAVEAAGGVTRRADLTAINLAAPVKDGQQVIVPVRGGAAGARGGTASGGGGSSGGAASGGGGGSSAGGAKISLSTATVEQLDALDGIGPTLAQRIIAWRDANGGFRSVDQLREVDGIGEKRFAALRDAVVP